MEKINALITINPLYFLKEALRDNPVEFRKAIQEDVVEGRSIYSRLLSKYPAHSVELTKLFLQEGYDPRKCYADKPEYLSIRDTNAKVLLTEHCDAEFLQEMDKNHTILLYAYYEANNYNANMSAVCNLIRELHKKGVRSNPNILIQAEKKEVLLRLYYELNPDASMQRLSQFAYLKDKCRSITKKYDDSELKEFIKSHVPSMSAEDQEEVMALTVIAGNKSFYNYTASLLGYNSKSYRSKHIPAWKYLGESNTHEFINYFVSQVDAGVMTYKDTIENITFIDELSKCMIKHGCVNKGHYNTPKTQAINEKINLDIDMLPALCATNSSMTAFNTKIVDFIKSSKYEDLKIPAESIASILYMTQLLEWCEANTVDEKLFTAVYKKFATSNDIMNTGKILEMAAKCSENFDTLSVMSSYPVKNEKISIFMEKSQLAQTITSSAATRSYKL